ncbi:MAG TPA: TIM barrel protein [Anaerolineaceae bacterium]|nr:TIM barrel protein [Anaerolineaceae bacterium]HOT25850.1 TIM barrel protein [Anaerolineaceae bacterium]HQH58101.1 TIM barrel protein [Anaerolineaceae bacterium]HQK03678.1 TIM barrel protein [Anaerolineaceae bacterium]HQL27606.1 TIM barrel protein [Anaerolineaceae bacterium]
MSRISMQNISVMTVQYWHYSFAYVLDSIEKCGLKYLELWAGDPHYSFDDYPDRASASRKIASLRKQIEDRGMKVIMLTPEQLNYPINLAGRDEEYRQKSIRYFTRSMEDALEFGTNRLFVTSGWGLLDEPREEAWKRSIDSMRVLAKRAEELGVQLIVEQLQPYESNLITTCADMQRMLAETDSEQVQCCVDLVAMAVVGETLQSFFDALGKRVQHIHFADGNPSGHYILGDGNLPLRDYIDTLERNDYEGNLTLEINDSIYWDDPHTSIERSAQYLRRLLPEA